MRYKFAVPLIAVVGTIVATDLAYAQVVPENAPLIETKRQSFFRAPLRERTILRPQTSTGETQGTPNENENYYLAPSS
jgi:hypothetical protein